MVVPDIDLFRALSNGPVRLVAADGTEMAMMISDLRFTLRQEQYDITSFGDAESKFIGGPTWLSVSIEASIMGTGAKVPEQVLDQKSASAIIAQSGGRSIRFGKLEP